MHHANHFYGHAEVLARWCGRERAGAIFGYLQHGWNFHDGYAVGHHFVPGFPKLVWSDVVARRGWSMGQRGHVVIGSPWSYLLQLEAQRSEGGVTPQREGTIVYPFHGWEDQNVLGDHAAYATEVREREGDHVTMCLYWNDFEKAAIRAVYEDRGFRVISHGRRGHMHQGADDDFIERQMHEVRRHRRVVSNRLGTALLYGASTGAEIGVYGDPMVLEHEHAVLGGMARQRRLFPELHVDAVPQDVAMSVAVRELGMDRVLPPDELAEALGWT